MQVETSWSTVYPWRLALNNLAVLPTYQAFSLQWPQAWQDQKQVQTHTFELFSFLTIITVIIKTKHFLRGNASPNFLYQPQSFLQHQTIKQLYCCHEMYVNDDITSGSRMVTDMQSCSCVILISLTMSNVRVCLTMTIMAVMVYNGYWLLWVAEYSSCWLQYRSARVFHYSWGNFICLQLLTITCREFWYLSILLSCISLECFKQTIRLFQIIAFMQISFVYFIIEPHF